MSLIHPQKYFWRILTTIGVVSIVFQLVTFSILAYFMVVPLGQRAADDLVGVMINSAEIWQLTLPDQRPAFIAEIKKHHNLVIRQPDPELSATDSSLPYLYFLRKSLQQQIGENIPINQSLADNGEAWYWVDIPVQNEIIRYGFPRSRIGVNPPITLFLLTIIGLLLTIITAVKLTRWLTGPVERLHSAAKAVGKSQWPEPLEIEGPEELTVLAQEFNRMSIKVRELLTNRTTLLAGIAHDLRTPLTQIQLALSMLPDEGGDPELMKSIQADLDIINQLIGETLSISLELEEGEASVTDIAKELRGIIESTQSNGVEVTLLPGQPCRERLHRQALRRVVTNLLVNAIRYGDGKPVSVRYGCSLRKITISISDQGPGIPEQEMDAVFRPFYRLEKSRGSGTGGSGLGLAIVRQLSDANNWEVKLRPGPEGGTRAVLVIRRDMQRHAI